MLDDMIDSCDYSPDGKFLVLRNSYTIKEKSDLNVPVSLIDELIERKLTAHDLKQLLFVRHLTAGGGTRKVPMSELVNEDLTGKTVGIYFRNYEDSEWMSTDKAIGVRLDETDGAYSFAFPKEYEECFNGECSHHDDPEADESCAAWDTLQGFYFRGSETVLVTEKAENNG